MSTWAYFGCVALVTAMGVAIAMLLRPTFAHTVLQMTGIESIPQAAPNSFYAVRVAPLFQEHCIGCHGAARQKGDLQLDSFAGIMRGAKHGPVIVAGDAKDSSLIDRVTLPEGDDRAMPPSGKTPLRKDDIKVIRLWIAAGASGTLPVNAIKGAPRLVKPVTMPDINPAAVKKQRAPLAADVARLQGRFPGVINYESRDSADLIVDASLKRADFGDTDLRALQPLQGRIVEINLGGTAVTDASAPALAAMKSLRVVRLAGTKTTDTTVQALAPLKGLKVLMVAKVSPGSLAPLRQKGVSIYGDADGE